jgi:cell division protein FtsX
MCSSSGKTIALVLRLVFVILIKFILLMISTGVLKTCRKVEQIYTKKIVRQVGYLQEKTQELCHAKVPHVTGYSNI